MVEFKDHICYASDYGEDYTFEIPQSYEFVKFLGKGSFGKVFRATDSINRDVAIKYIDFDKYEHGDMATFQRVVREAMILHHIKSPVVVKLYNMYMTADSLEDMRGLYLVTEYCGQKLTPFLLDQFRLDHISYVLYHIILGVRYLNSLGIYHRDLKPENVCLDIRPEGIQSVKIIDLGMARIKPRATESSLVTRKISTFIYRAPEMMIGDKYKQNLDIWSLGCIFGYMLGKKHLFWDGGKLEAALIVRNIIKRVGKPSQKCIDCIESIQQETNRSLMTFVVRGTLAVIAFFHLNTLLKKLGMKAQLERRKKMCRPYVDKDVYTEIMKCVNDTTIPQVSDYLDRLPKLLPLDNNSLQLKVSGLKLIKGMLKWDKDERFDIEQVLSSDFFRDCRNTPYEALPDEELRDEVREALRESDEATRYKSIDELKYVILKHMVKQYPTDNDGEVYPYVENWRDPEWVERFMTFLLRLSVPAVFIVPLVLVIFYGYEPKTSFASSFSIGAVIVAGLDRLEKVIGPVMFNLTLFDIIWGSPDDE